MRETILKIKDIGINRSYGFHNGGYIVVGRYYKNHRPVKDSKDIVFSDRSSIAEDYAIACGINREDKMNELVGKQVDISYEQEDGYEYQCLTRPFSVSKKLGKNRFEAVLQVCCGEAEEEEAS